MNRKYYCNTHKQILRREGGMFPMTKYELEKENERLQKAIKVQEIMLGNQDRAIKKARTEAIKEVYTRLSMNFGTYTDNDSVKLVDLFRIFDQIAKEMGVEL